MLEISEMSTWRNFVFFNIFLFRIISAYYRPRTQRGGEKHKKSTIKKKNGQKHDNNTFRSALKEMELKKITSKQAHLKHCASSYDQSQHLFVVEMLKGFKESRKASFDGACML